jgi:hypothetical protein
LSRFRYAQALTRRGRANDLRLAQNALATARQEAGTLGMLLPDYAHEPPGRPMVATCARAGQQWRIQYGRRSLLVSNSTGMAHLSALLTKPGLDVPAVELAAGPRAPSAVAVGHGERAGGNSKEAERARLAVSKAIRRAINAVAQLDEQIGSHLHDSVKTGTRCSYLPH